MRIGFYSPIAKPNDTTPSGISRVGALLVQALKAAGHIVDIPLLPRSYEGKGNPERQKQIFAECQTAGTNYLEAIALGKEPRPDLWFSYHVYYKSPDWVGPRIARSLGIPYVVAEGSHAPKRANSPWAFGHDATTKALQTADRLLAMTSFDRVCLERIDKARVRDLKPFIDPAPFTRNKSNATRGNRVIAVGMMRNERKVASYRLLAEAMRLLPDLRLDLEIAGDGILREDIVSMFKPADAHNIRFLGAIAAADIPDRLLLSGILAWPGIGEAYGLVYLEAQAAGLAVVACRDRGVPDVVREDETALLSVPGDAAAYAANLRLLIEDNDLRAKLGNAGRAFARRERSVEAAARTLNTVLAEIKPK
ncbi:MAG: glycosyltransferase [Alphaproteobacteria bacterium]|nr:glycosyltransferase [Alphaproteobacteria bacterium]